MSDLSDFKSFIGNPVVSGTVTGTNIVLTRADASTVTIDAERLVNGTEATIGLPNWYQTYANPGNGSSTAGAQIDTNTPPNTANPYYFGVTLKRGREFAFPHSTGSETIFYGIWGGAVTYTPIQAGKSAYWSKHLKISSSDDQVQHGTDEYDSVGWDLTTDYEITHGTTQCVLQYAYDTNKLKLWDVTGDYWHLAATAVVAQDGNPVIISCAVASGGSVPNFTDREQDWNIIAQVNAGVDTTWRDGVLINTVIKHNRGLHPGEKMVISTPASWGNHYIGFDYTGTSTGQTLVVLENTAAIQMGQQERLYQKDGFTINTKAERYDTSTHTDVMGGAKLSWRYHTDYSMDIFDEDNEDVLFTKNVDMDGSVVFMHMYFSTNVSLAELMHPWTFEPFAHDWYVHSASPYVGSATNDNVAKRPNQRHIYTGTGPGLGPNEETTKMWGELMYPGQELVWTHDQSGFVAGERTQIGLRNATDTTWLKYITYEVTNFKHQPMLGFDRGSWYGLQSSNILALRYDYSDHKLKIYELAGSGVETLITTALIAEDGNAIRPNIRGDGNALVGASLRYYGWEYKHISNAGGPQPWKNWRCDRPAANDRIVMDTVLQYRLALIPGRYFQWPTTTNDFAHFNGGWKSSNATTGLTNVEITDSFWDWGWYSSNAEFINDNKLGMTFNTSNSNYNPSSAGYWDDPAPGTTILRLRYKSDDSVDLYDQSSSQVILTKDTDLDGSPFYFAIGLGAGITDIAKLHGGGDLTTGTL